jgi:hypothetical protein
MLSEIEKKKEKRKGKDLKLQKAFVIIFLMSMGLSNLEKLVNGTLILYNISNKFIMWNMSMLHF